MKSISKLTSERVEKFKNQTDDKINEILSFLQNQVASNIQSVETKLASVVTETMNKTIHQTDTNDDRQLKADQERFFNAIRAQDVLTLFKPVATITSSLGYIGKVLSDFVTSRIMYPKELQLSSSTSNLLPDKTFSDSLQASYNSIEEINRKTIEKRTEDIGFKLDLLKDASDYVLDGSLNIDLAIDSYRSRFHTLSNTTEIGKTLLCNNI